jgi:hypothetical protein
LLPPFVLSRTITSLLEKEAADPFFASWIAIFFWPCLGTLNKLQMPNARDLQLPFFLQKLLLLADVCDKMSCLIREQRKRPCAFEQNVPRIPGPGLRSNYTTKHEIEHRANAKGSMQKSHKGAIHASIEVRDKHQKNLHIKI